MGRDLSFVPKVPPTLLDLHVKQPIAISQTEHCLFNGLVLVPDASCSMMWNLLISCRLLLLHRIVQEKVYQYCVHLHLWVHPLNFFLNQFDTPYTTT